MNYNIIAYAIFTALMIFIIVYVGTYFYRNGRVFIISLLQGNISLADHINRLLLVAYCLFNIGFAFMILRFWQPVSNVEMLFSSLSRNMGLLVLILATTHYCNMLGIYFFSKSDSLTNKTFQL